MLGHAVKDVDLLDRIIDAASESVGMYPEAWDMVSPHELVQAIIWAAQRERCKTEMKLSGIAE